MTPDQTINRQTEALYSSTRSEILMSIAAALLLVGVTLLRFWQVRTAMEEIGCALVLVWIALTLYRLRPRIWRQAAPPDAVAATGAEYYRRELERRRDHLRDAWLWHGPLFLACLILVGVGGSHFGMFVHMGTPIGRVVPLIVLLVLWTGYGLRRRLRQARALQREIDQIASPAGSPPAR